MAAMVHVVLAFGVLYHSLPCICEDIFRFFEIYFNFARHAYRCNFVQLRNLPTTRFEAQTLSLAFVLNARVVPTIHRAGRP